jgi:hypothetical protein
MQSVRKFARVVVALSSLLVLVPACAAAQTQITIGAGTGGSVEFSGAGQTQLSLIGSCSQTNCIQGDAYLGSNVGTYTMWISGNNPIVSATGTPNIFAVNMNGGTMNFNFLSGSSAINGTIQLTSLASTSAPQFIGTLTVSGSSGIFAALWKAGNVVPLDFTVSLPQGNSLVSQVVNGQAGSTFGDISSGEILAAPEPATIALIGSGLLAIGGVLKRHKRK